MDLTRRLRRWAVARPRVLVVDAPGSTTLRWTVEAQLDRREWPLALSPAETDLLLVLGEPGADLARAVDVVWSQVPAPRHRTDIRSDDDVAAALDAAVDALVEAADRGRSADDERPHPDALLEQRGGDDGAMDHGGHGSAEHGDHAGTDQALMHHGGHAGMDHGGTDHGGHGSAGHGGHAGTDHAAMEHAGMHLGGHGGPEHGHEGMDHGDHGGMDHEAMGSGGHAGMDHSGHMGMDVAGLPMADTAPDRDGLQLDALDVALGPVLTGWPTGLVLWGRLQGDVLTSVTLTWADVDTGIDRRVGDSGDARLVALDRLSRFLQVAGWPTAARDARRALDRLRSADPAQAEVGRRLAVRLARRVRRSRTLAWSVRGIGRIEHEAPDSHGDVLDRVQRWCELVAAPRPAVHELPDLSLEQVARLLDGAELAAARLVVASLPLVHPATQQRGVSARV